MPKASEIVRQIKKAGCVLVRHGKRHDIWENPAIPGARTEVSRHPSKEIPNGTYRSILKDLGLE